MNLRAAGVLFWTCLIGTAAIAGEEYRTRIEIAIDDDASGQQSFLFDSQAAGFDLDSMVVGETRTLTDEFGRTADLRRTDDGFEIDVDGKTVDLPDLRAPGLHGEHEVEMRVGGTDADAVVVTDARQVKIIKTEHDDGVTVISGSEIDAATRERIREALQAGGQDSDVLFIDGSEFDVDGNHQVHGRHGVRIIKQEVDVTN
jgi:hypothetical protein